MLALADEVPPRFTIEQIGLSGPGYERSDGYSESSTEFLNDAGQVAGYSIRYSNNTALGQDPWLYTGTGTVLVGLTGAGYEQSNGYRSSTLQFLNDSGWAAGRSLRYGTGSSGSDAWLYNGTGMSLIGLTGPGYVRNDGNRYTNVAGLNNAGQAAGHSSRYSGTTALGNDAWLYTAGSTVVISLMGADYQSSNGSRNSVAVALNNAGQVAGSSTRYSGTTSLGSDAWLYTPTGTTLIGLTGTDYQKSNGFGYSEPEFLNDAGQVVGYALLYYSGGSVSGRDAWLFNGTATTLIGLTDASHTTASGSRDSYARFLNSRGEVAGTTVAVGLGHCWWNFYIGETSCLGDSHDSWFYNGSGTVQIGLTGAEYQWPSGYRYSEPVFLNNSGQVAGYSRRYNGDPNASGDWVQNPPYASGSGGQHPWFYNGTSTVPIGLTGPEYGDYSNYQRIYLVGLNDAGQAVGYSSRDRYPRGIQAWRYDSTLNQTIPLPPLSTNSVGESYTTPLFITNDGLIVGYYTYYDTDTGLGSTRAFYFTVASGMQDLGALTENLDAAGWQSLVAATRANASGNIVGTGLKNPAGSSRGFMLSPVPVTVEMDVDPWSTANQVQPNNADSWVTAAILGQNSALGDPLDFDVTQIDVASLKLGAGEAPNDATPWIADWNNDATPDLLVGFRTVDTGIACGDTEVTLTGKTHNNVAFEATDTIETIDCETNSCHP